MAANLFELVGGIDIIVDSDRGVKGAPKVQTDGRKKLTVLFNNNDDFQVFTDKMLELGVTYADLSLKKP